MPAISVRADDLPAPKGHYSHAMVGGGLVFVSGQLPNPADGSEPPADFAAQAEVAVGNMLVILKAAGLTAADLVKVTAYIVGVENWAAFNSVYARLLGDARPARAVVPVPELHYGFLVEIDAIATARDRTQ
ncbi:MAG: RidA family protein [Sphingopyxis sp.]|nr:RidA family protein [Sphingopyxis sp.]